MGSEHIRAEREEILSLRARIVVLERAVMAALELALRLRPEDLQRHLDMTRTGLNREYKDLEFAPDLTEPHERGFVAGEVERLMSALQADMGFYGGVSGPENG